ncbi:hypothetical protein EYF80_066119 [Liparis tanakae]|uniref:Uncharacterized protein n=1 Tax=Liparis tanakae TaxID=230148 RepID=A0A4Z2E4S5_9TELE|nr:hypothetical protein EYF80_066119 [Liparis tanakae]
MTPVHYALEGNPARQPIDVQEVNFSKCHTQHNNVHTNIMYRISYLSPSPKKAVEQLGKVCSGSGDGPASGQVIAGSQKNHNIRRSLDNSISDLRQQVPCTGPRNGQDTDRKICWGLHKTIHDAS